MVKQKTIGGAYLIIVADAADAVSVNFCGRCKFLQKNWHSRQILCEKVAFFLQIFREKLAFFGVNFIRQKFCQCKKNDKYQVCGGVVDFLIQGSLFYIDLTFASWF